MFWKKKQAPKKTDNLNFTTHQPIETSLASDMNSMFSEVGQMLREVSCVISEANSIAAEANHMAMEVSEEKQLLFAAARSGKSSVTLPLKRQLRLNAAGTTHTHYENFTTTNGKTTKESIRTSKDRSGRETGRYERIENGHVVASCSISINRR